MDLDFNVTFARQRIRLFLLWSRGCVCIRAGHLERGRHRVIDWEIVILPLGLGMQSRSVIRSARQMIDYLRPRP